MQLNLHRLWIFTQVVECGGFSAAAQKLYMSQPSVSNQVRQLEQSLQVTLIDRSGGRTRPTAEGEVLVKYAQRVFSLADEAVAAVRQVSGLETGRLLVGGTTSVGTYLLPILLARYRKRYPGVELDILVGNLEQVERALLDGELGLAVVAGRPAASQLTTAHILDEQLVLISSVDHPSARRTVDATALRDGRFLLREQGSHTRALQESALQAWGLADVRTGEFWGAETIKQSVSVGLGVSLISEHAVTREVQDGSLAIIHVEPVLPARPINLAFRADRLLAPAEAAFLNLMKRVHGWPVPPVEVVSESTAQQTDAPGTADS